MALEYDKSAQSQFPSADCYINVASFHEWAKILKNN